MKYAFPAWLLSLALAAAQQNPPASQDPVQQAPPQAAAPQQSIQVFPQQPQAAPPAAPAEGSGSQSQSAAPAGGSNFLGKDVPFFDPGSNIATWDGKNWNISNNAFFQARFETIPQRPGGHHRVREPGARPCSVKLWICWRRAGSRPSPVDLVFPDLAKASRFQQDAHLCDSIASQVYSAWLSRRSNDRLNAASKSLEDERKRLEWNARLTAEGTKLESSGGGGSGKSSSGKSSSGKSNEGGRG